MSPILDGERPWKFQAVGMFDGFLVSRVERCSVERSPNPRCCEGSLIVFDSGLHLLGDEHSFVWYQLVSNFIFCEYLESYNWR